MNFQWEEFRQKPGSRAEIPRVSLNARGHFLLNKRAVEEMGEPEAVVLLFDRASRRIGLKGCGADVEHAYELKKQGASHNYQLRAKSFCIYYGIEVGDPVVFQDIRLEDGVVILDLDNVTEIVRRARYSGLAEFPIRHNHAAKPSVTPKFSTLLRRRLPDDE